MSYFSFNLPAPRSAQISKEIRDNLDALAVNNATANPAKPANPKNGMLRFLYDDTGSVSLQYYWSGWKTLFVNMQLGVSTLKRVELSSIVPVLTWTIDHNFGVNPIVQFIDPAGEVCLPEKVEHVNTNRVVVSHSDPVAGKVVLIG